MKIRNLSPFALLTNLVLACVVALGALFMGAEPLAALSTAGVVLAFGLTLKKKSGSHNYAHMALQTEVWATDISENLFEGADFIKYSVDDSQWVENKTVHLPQSGAKPGVVKNRNVFPAVVTQRTDTENTYDLSEYTTDPIVVRDIEAIQVSYAKRQSVLRDHVETLNERIGTEVLYAWAPTTSATLVLRTTGAATANLPNATATGTRRLLTKEDVARCAAKLDTDLLPKSNRFMQMTVSMYYEMFGIDALINSQFMGKVGLPDGVINKLFDFNILPPRPTVLMYNNAAAGVLKAVGAADAATDCSAALAWHSSSVRNAKGAITVYANEKQATYYGDIFSAMVLHGAKAHRTDFRGIVALAQGYVTP